MQEHPQGWRPEEAGGQLREKDWNRNKTYTLVLSVHSYHPSRLWDLKSFKKISVGDSEFFFSYIASQVVARAALELLAILLLALPPNAGIIK